MVFLSIEILPRCVIVTRRVPTVNSLSYCDIPGRRDFVSECHERWLLDR